MPKRAANGDGMLRQRKDKRWEYRVIIGYDENQKAIPKSFYDKTKTGVKAKYREWLKQPAEVRIEQVKIVGEWATIWLETYKKDKVAYGTYNNYRMYVGNHIIPVIGNLKFEDVKPAHIQKVMNKISKLSRSARQHVKIALNGIFETAIDNHYCTINPCRKIELKKDIKPEPEVFSTKEIECILQKARYVKDGYIIELLLYTGLRIGEASGLQWGDIDLENHIITVRKSVAKAEVGGYETTVTKSGKERRVGITPNLVNVFSRIPKNGLYVLAESPDSFQNPYNLAKRYKKALSSINAELPEDKKVRELTAHKCRHTYATYLLKGGANLRQVQQLLGHSAVTVTEVYTHIDTEDVKKSVTKLPY